MSSNGKRIVIGAPHHHGYGKPDSSGRVYNLYGTSWRQVGGDIYSQRRFGQLGYSVL